MISRSAEYAVRALAHLAEVGDRWVLNREIARELDLPPQFLTKLLGTLARQGLLASQRGRTGGFRLARPASSITLLEIVDPFDRISDRHRCLLGQAVCSDQNACPLHESWRGIQDDFRALFGHTTLEQVIAGTATGAFPKAGPAPRVPAKGRRPGRPSRA